MLYVPYINLFLLCMFDSIAEMLTVPWYKSVAVLIFRLDSIAGDAELMEKPSADLKRIADLLQTQCQQAVLEYAEKKDDPEIEGELHD